MQTAPHAPAKSGHVTATFAQRALRPIARRLRTGVEAATVDRFFGSQLLRDLQFIVAVGYRAVVSVFIVGLVLSFESEVVGQWKSISESRTHWIWLHIIFVASGNFLTFFAPVLAAFGAVLAWAYQVGSARLGVVDLFACEISTLCRVALVVDSVCRYIDQFDRGPAAALARPGDPQEPAHPFTSQENYFPVFESNSRDLQTLEARVVINITAFYTYMKAVRDSARTLAEITPQPAESGPPSTGIPANEPWHEAILNIVYMLFLGLESARKAIGDLVEFEPEKAERMIVILISELEAYRFLCSHFPMRDEIHHARLWLRGDDYQGVPHLCHSVEAGTKSENGCDWEPAWVLVPALTKRFNAAMAAINR